MENILKEAAEIMTAFERTMPRRDLSVSRRVIKWLEQYHSGVDKLFIGCEEDDPDVSGVFQSNDGRSYINVKICKITNHVKKLSEVAEKQINEIQYALGCSRPKAICHALEAMNAFEEITDDQIFNWLDTHHKEKLNEWEVKNEGKRAKLASN